jgi:hypothetical protein
VTAPVEEIRDIGIARYIQASYERDRENDLLNADGLQLVETLANGAGVPMRAPANDGRSRSSAGIFAAARAIGEAE